MGSAPFELLVIALLIMLNGFFSMAEFALIRARKGRLEQKAAEGSRRARVALQLVESPGRLLSTVQIGITLVGVLAGAFGGATVAEKIAVSLEGVKYLDPYRHVIGLGIVVLVISYLTLMFGELLPKRLGLARADSLALVVAQPMQWLSRLASPLVTLLTFSTDWISRVPLLGTGDEPPVTVEEVRMMLDSGTRAGVFEPAEKDIVERVFRLGDQRVASLMTPRTDIVWLDLNDPLAETIRLISSSGHSRFPVSQGSMDNVVGTVRAKDILPRILRGEVLDLRASMREPLFVPNSMRALKVLELFKKSATHMAVVVDEHGGIEGLVTDHDVLEGVVGDVAFVDYPVEQAVVRREDGSYLVDGMIGIDEFKERFKLPRLTGEERSDYHTLGGFVMQQIGRIPAPGDYFETSGQRFEVVDMDGRRVDKVLVEAAKTAEEPPTDEP
jgi:putative hemolysin